MACGCSWHDSEVTPVEIDSRLSLRADSGDSLPAAFWFTVQLHTGERSGRGGRPHLDKDERKIVHRHLDELE